MSEAGQPMDHVPPGSGAEGDRKNDLEKNIKEKSTWLRLVFMLLLGLAWSIAVVVLTAVVVLNFLYVLIGGETNARLTRFGHQLGTYLYRIVEFQTFNSEVRPFPFDEEWPAE